MIIRKAVLFIGIIIFVLILFACDVAGSVSSNDETDDEIIDEGKTTIEFNFNELGSSRSATRGELNPNTIAYIDIEEGFDYTGGSPNRLPNNSLDFHFLPLSEKNILEVEKGGNYRIAFIYDPRANSKQLKTNRAISDSITSIGDWKDVTSDLETIPLSENARDKIELGEVSSNENSEAFESSVSMDEMVANTGVEEDRLTDYSQFDHTTKKFMNIDINRNGIPDSEDDLIWRGYSTTFFRGYPTQSQFENNTFPVEELKYFGSKINFISNIDYPGQAVVELPFPVEFTPTGESIDTRTAAVLDPGTEPFAEEKIDFAGFHFSSAFEPRAPYNGEYAFYSSEYPEEKYYVDLVFHSYDNNYEGMPVPIIFGDFDEETGEMTIWWKWLKIQGGAFVPLDKE